MAGSNKKGLSPLAWVGIGCGGLAFIAIALAVFGAGILWRKASGTIEEFKANPMKAAAEFAINSNPDLEYIDSDDDSGTISFRDTRTGKKQTLSFEQAADGGFSITTDEGAAVISAGGEVEVTSKDGTFTLNSDAGTENTPAWAKAFIYPDSGSQKSTFTSNNQNGEMGNLTSTAANDPEEVVRFYKDLLEGQGYELDENTSKVAGELNNAVLLGKKDKRTISVVVSPQRDGGSHIILSYQEKK